MRRRISGLTLGPVLAARWRRRRPYLVACGESRIAYEASNHYFYTPVDLLEEMLNCEQVIEELRTELPPG